MAISAKERFAELPEPRQKAIRARTEAILKEMTLAELRKARQRSQVKLAKKLGIKQAAVSRLERRADMYVSTLRDTIEAMGGSMTIIAQFPDHPPVCVNLIEESEQGDNRPSPEMPISASRMVPLPGSKFAARVAAKRRIVKKDSHL